MKSFRIAVIVAFSVLVVIGIQSANPPGIVNYQGVLRNPAGKALDGTYDMTFRFFDTATAGNEIMLDEHKSAGSGAVTVSKGLFGVPLGSGVLMDGSATFCNDPYTTMVKMFQDFTDVWMQIEIGQGTPEVLLPRIKINSAPYALKPQEEKRWVIQDVQPEGTYGQLVNFYPEPNQWVAKNFNSIITNSGDEVIFSGNTFTIKPGRYNIQVTVADEYNAPPIRLRLFDITHSTSLVPPGIPSSDLASLDEIVTFQEQCEFRVEVVSQNQVYFLGSPLGFGPEVYAQVTITKLN